MDRVLTIAGDTAKWAAQRPPPAFPGFKEKLVKKSDKLELWLTDKGKFEYRLMKGKYIIGVQAVSG